MARKEILELEGKVNSKELVKEFEKVKDEVKETTKEVDKLGDKGSKDLKKLENQTKKTSLATRLVAIGVKAIGVAFKALGIGLVVAIIAKLTQAFTQNQKVLDGLNNVFETINIVFSQFTTAVIDIFENVKKATNGFEALGKVVNGIITIALTPLKNQFFAIKLAVQQAQLAWEKSFFGKKDPETINELNQAIKQTRLDIVGVATDAANAGIDIVTNFSKAIEDIKSAASIANTELGKVSIDAAKEQAKSLVEAKNASQLASAQQQLLIEKFDQQAEIQRQIRDDDRIGISDRIKANQELNKVLELQQKAQIEQANIQLRAAQLQVDINNNAENNVALIQAQSEKQGVLATIEVFRSEQRINEASLERELLELQNSRTEAESKLSFQQQRASATRLEDEETRLIRFQQIAILERDAELKRLQERISNTKIETQARIDAENQFAQAKFDLNEGIKKSDDDLTEFKKKTGKTEEKVDELTNEAKIQMAEQTLGAIGGLLGDSAKAQKAVGIATAIIDTLKGINAGVALGFPQAIPAVAAAAATGFATVKKIISTKVPSVPGSSGGGVGGGTRSAGAVAPQAVAPSFNIVGDSGSNQITDAINTQGNRPARAYVVSKDITTQQALDRNTQDNSSLG